MKEVIQWLRRLEQRASDFYSELATHVVDDKATSDFFLKLADDENSHFHLLGSAAELLRESNDYPSATVVIDESLRKRIEDPLEKCHSWLMKGEVSKKAIFECIVRMEFSEWNDIFLYIIQTCQEHSKAFQRIAADVQDHKERIESFMNSLPEPNRPPLHVSELPQVWKRRHLVVEDDDAILGLYERLLSREAAVVRARNGREALEYVQDKFFNAILSDLDMPVMNGLEFFERASSTEEDLAKRFILCPSNLTPDISAFCARHGIRLLQKPVMITELLDVLRSAAEISA
jgi:two-component system chemotaxis response regulator CheY